MPCPDGLDSPTTWFYNETPDKVEGSMACGTNKDDPIVLWTKDSDLLLGYAYGPPGLVELHDWWLEFG